MTGIVDPAILRFVSVDYLLHSDGAPQREYAKQAAADGVITYSYSTDKFKWIEPESSIRWTNATVTKNPVAADAQQSLWIDTIFGFIDSITGVQFQKVEGQRGEIHLNFVDGDISTPWTPDTEYTGAFGYLNGYAQMFSNHDKIQYGGLVDIRAIQTSIMGALGVTAPDGKYDSSNTTYNWNNSLMANTGYRSFGATFFMTDDDQTALKSILGGSSSTSNQPEMTHGVVGRETLMIGTNGVRDIFKLTSKGMLLDKGTDAAGWYNHYNCSYVANLNSADGDKVLLHRSLLDPLSPIFSGSMKLGKKYRKTKLRVIEDIDAADYNSGANIYYNGAGKLIMDTNGAMEGTTPKGSPKHPELYLYNSAGLNGQIAAFIDPYGPESLPFPVGTVELFM